MKLQHLKYPDLPNFHELTDALLRYSRLAAEFGYDQEAGDIIRRIEETLQSGIETFAKIVENPRPDENEPEDWASILAQRPQGRHRLTEKLPEDYAERFLGAFIGRGAGCALGGALEFRGVQEMEDWARYCGDAYPLTDYWSMVKNPYQHRYILGTSEQLTKAYMDSIPVDDDFAYTLIGLLTLEKYGPNFTQQQMADLWKEKFPLQAANGSWGAYWGERKMLQNLHAGMPLEKAGYANNPNVQSIAAWTRADTWGYVAPGWPEKAAELAYRDASVNHRRNGVYGSMFFAASIAAAFAVDDPVEALHLGLQEIPQDSLFAEAIRWAFSVAPEIKSYKDGAAAVRERYAGMFEGHAINNALFVVFGIHIGGKDFTKVIGETIAMGMDNDCTGATAGSIVGAVIGKKNIPEHWYKPFNNRMHNYLNGGPEYVDFDDLLTRYTAQAKQIM
ncbi:ADP-ribosylglycohydrolase family protein [Paenibacillus sp.]|uniref:ADP-ribosylglycohydrolase family protein n=1 Tax=Paenibacillus sp. TaxID=58172 RepID=UPI002D5243D8|nr:ADP-ribosylglycohydrolase family protein [Paenibacillus sp.]HZG86021.1 ADP-ribosylglycohydrolase family protein [Paenibacillus sp.]